MNKKFYIIMDGANIATDILERFDTTVWRNAPELTEKKLTEAILTIAEILQQNKPRRLSDQGTLEETKKHLLSARMIIREYRAKNKK